VLNRFGKTVLQNLLPRIKRDLWIGSWERAHCRKVSLWFYYKGKGLPAGLCRAAVQAYKTQPESLHGKLQRILVHFFRHLSDHFRLAAMAVLVAGGVVERVVQHMVKEGPDVAGNGLQLMLLFMDNAAGRKRMCAGGIPDQLVKGIARWLFKVRDVPVKEHEMI
jgi:hypothetical protein